MDEQPTISHGAIWWRGEEFALLDVEPSQHGWTAHLSNHQGGFAVTIDGDTQALIDSLSVGG